MLGELRLRRYDSYGRKRPTGPSQARPRAVLPRTRLVSLLLIERRTKAQAVLWELYRLTNDPRQLTSLTGLALEGGPQQSQFRDVGGERDRVKGELERFLARAPDDPWLRRARGLIRYQLGRPDEARDDLESTVRLLEDDAIGQLALVKCRIALNDLDGIERPSVARPDGRPT